MTELFRGFYKTTKGSRTITLSGKSIIGEWLYWDEIGRFKSLSGDFLTQLHSDENKSDRITPAIYNNLISETITQAVTGLKDRLNWPVFTGDLVKDICTGHVYSVVFKDFSYLLKSRGYTTSIKKFDWESKMEIVGVKWS